MPDPHDVTSATKDMAKDTQMDTIVNKALKKKKRRRRRRTQKTAYDKLAMLVPSVTKVLQGASYGAAAGGFKPSVRVDSGNGWSSTKTPTSSPTHTKLSDDGWQGIQKDAMGVPGAGALAGAAPGALIGGGLGAVGGAGYGALFPGEDEQGNRRSRLLEAVKTGLLGAGLGGLGGAAVGGTWGHGAGSGVEALSQMSPEDREALMQLITSQG